MDSNINGRGDDHRNSKFSFGHNFSQKSQVDFNLRFLNLKIDKFFNFENGENV